ncbi:T7SS effector LXG polymorphic toxin [Lactococcus muris]|uniref:T7SS effector LXG polymorphic toxin n=1 Tax=Lactococcus muris TaxID=2941330 RepID=A0ABV4D7B6_9LACT
MCAKYIVSESSSLMRAMETNLRQSQRVTDTLKRATRQLTSSLQSGDLKGKAYGSAKNYVLNVLNPLMNKASEGISDGLADLATYKYEDSQIAHYGNIDVAQLQAEKQTKEEARRRVVSQRESLQTFPLSILATLSPVAYSGAIFAMNTFEHQMTDSIKDIDEKLLAFESFESNTNALFQDTNAVFEALQRAVNALNSIKISGSGAGLSLSMPSGMGGLVSKMTNSKLGAGDKDSSYVSLPSKYQDEIEKIKNSNLSATQKADRLVDLYEKYLYETNKSGFDKYREARDKFGTDPAALLPYEKELTQYLLKNGIDIRQIVNQMGDDLIEVTQLNWFKAHAPGYDLIQFYNLVQTNKPLDIKNRPFGENGITWSIWGRGYSEEFYDADGTLRSDYLGNYLFGYYGKGANATETITDFLRPTGFPLFEAQIEKLTEAQILKLGAGLAQLFSDAKNKEYTLTEDAKKYFENFINGGFGDNPSDAKSIQDGISAYEQKK